MSRARAAAEHECAAPAQITSNSDDIDTVARSEGAASPAEHVDVKTGSVNGGHAQQVLEAVQAVLAHEGGLPLKRQSPFMGQNGLDCLRPFWPMKGDCR